MDKISKRLEGGLFFGVKCNRLLETLERNNNG